MDTADIRRPHKAVLNRCPAVGTADVRRPHKAVLKPISHCGYCRSSKNAQSCSQADVPLWVLLKFEDPTKLFSSQYPSVGTAEVRRTHKAVLNRCPLEGTAEVRRPYKAVLKPISLCGNVQRTYKVVLKPKSGSCWCGVLQKFIKKPTTRIHTERSIITRSSASVGR